MSKEEWEWESRMIDMENQELDRQYLEELERERTIQLYDLTGGQIET